MLAVAKQTPGAYDKAPLGRDRASVRHGQAEGPAILRIRVFGTFSIENGGRRLRIRSRRGRALIAYLAIAGREGASRERLSGLLWSDRGEEQARASLRQCLLELRRELEDAGVPVLDAGREQVALAQGVFESDLEDLQDAIHRHDGAALAGALRTIGPDALLEDLSVGGLFDEWLFRTRAQVESAIELEVRTLLEAAEASRAWDQLRAVAEAFLLRSPTDEVVAAAAIRADMAQGITSAAHRRFRALENTLAQEYGLRPGSEVSQALSARAQAAAVAAPSVPASQVAAPAAAPSPPIVIVSAFEGADRDASTQTLAEVIRDEVVSGLSRFRDLHVVTDPQPTSSLDHVAFADPRLVFALGARMRPGAQPGVTVQLIRLQTRGIVWSERFEVPEGEILSATDSIIARVVGAVLPSIDQELFRPLREADGDSSYLRYLHARTRARGATTHEEARSAAADLQALVDTHPRFVLPYLPLARLYNTDFNHTLAGSSDAACREYALSLAKKAMSIDRGHDHCYTLTAWCYLRLRQWEPASELLEQALSRNPFSAMRLSEIGFGFFFLGETARARELLDRCLLVNPTPEDGFFNDLGVLELSEGAHDRAATYFALVANPSVWSTIYQAVNAELGGRRTDGQSQRARERIAAIWPQDRPMDEDAVLNWMLAHNPFRSKDVEERFLTGARMMLGRASSLRTPA